jgi:predicted Zn-dependent protease
MRPTALLVCLSGLALGASCAVNPATGQKELALVSESQEIQMGLSADPSIVTSMGLDPDSGRQGYVRALGMRLASTSERPNLPWTFRVIDDPVVNAFAIPGGHIYITRGIMAHLNSEAELAGVMGHEIGHVTARHSVQQMSRQQIAQMGLVVGTVIEPKLQRYAGAASQSLGLLFLKFSRDDESQADYLGYRYMRRQRYDGRQMAQVFTLLDRVTQASGDGRIPDWLATHPNPGNRLEAIQRDIAATPRESLGTVVNREAYLQAIDGIVYGDNPRDGYVRNGEFVHPALRFRISFPAAWTVQNQRDAVQAVSPQQDAVVQLSIATQPTPDQAATAFFSQQGVTGTPARVTLRGLPATTAEFAAATDQGAVAGRVTYVDYEGHVYQILAITSQDRWPGVRDVAWRATTSFDRLTDPAVLAVQPWHVQVVTVQQSMTVEEFVRRNPGPVPVATVALLNNVGPGDRFAAGSLAKRIVGDPLP